MYGLWPGKKGALRAFGRGPTAFNVGRPNGWGDGVVTTTYVIFVLDLFNLFFHSIYF